MKIKNGNLEQGQKVFVYRNLRTGTWSVKDRKTNKVIKHTDEVFLRDVDFKVSKKGNERVRKEKSKNVHAGVQGFVDDVGADLMAVYPLESFTEVTYDPYKHKTFVTKKNGHPIYKAQIVLMIKNKVFVYDVPSHI